MLQKTSATSTSRNACEESDLEKLSDEADARTRELIGKVKRLGEISRRGWREKRNLELQLQVDLESYCQRLNQLREVTAVVPGCSAATQPSSNDLYLRLKKPGITEAHEIQQQLREEQDMRKKERKLRLEAEQMLREYAVEIEKLKRQRLESSSTITELPRASRGKYGIEQKERDEAKAARSANETHVEADVKTNLGGEIESQASLVGATTKVLEEETNGVEEETNGVEEVQGAVMREREE